MYLRCSRCHEPTWIRSLIPGLVEDSIECQDCGHEHDLSRSNKLGETVKEQYEIANEFATRNGVDLPTAYSILLGLMSMQEARDADAAQKETQRKKADPPQAFEPSADSLTQAEDSLTQTMDAAARAVDATAPAIYKPAPATQRRVSPPRRRKTPPHEEQTVTIHVERDMAEERRQLTWSQLALLIVLAALTLGFSGRHAYRTWRGLVEEGRVAQEITTASAEAFKNAEEKVLAEARKSASGQPHALRATVRRDDEGLVTQVSGSNPMTVLEAYCKAASGPYEREPLELAQATPPGPDQRYGIFRDFSRLESNRAIRIIQDRETQRWVVGDGRTPIQTREAPADPDTIRRASLSGGH